jgi:hypothetical protein
MKRREFITLARLRGRSLYGRSSPTKRAGLAC